MKAIIVSSKNWNPLYRFLQKNRGLSKADRVKKNINQFLETGGGDILIVDIFDNSDEAMKYYVERASNDKSLMEISALIIIDDSNNASLYHGLLENHFPQKIEGYIAPVKQELIDGLEKDKFYSQNEVEHSLEISRCIDDFFEIKEGKHGLDFISNDIDSQGVEKLKDLVKAMPCSTSGRKLNTINKISIIINQQGLSDKQKISKAKECMAFTFSSSARELYSKFKEGYNCGSFSEFEKALDKHRTSQQEDNITIYTI